MSVSRRAAYVVATAAIATTSAFAAITAKDPGTLVLRKADFPRGATYEASDGDDSGIQDALAAKGVDSDAANYLGATYSKAKGFLQVSGAVFTTASAAKAKTAFSIAKAERAAFAKRLRSDAKPITLPKYGDQQYATYSPAGGEGIHGLEVLVRRNAVVWLISVGREKRPPIPKAAFLTEAKTYVLKQKGRIGNG